MQARQSPRTPLSQGILSDNTQDLFGSYSDANKSETGRGRNISSPIIRTAYDDGSPRQTTPTKSKPSHRPKSVTELSLSDVEHEVRKLTPNLTQRRLPKVTHEVVVVETDKENIYQSGEVQTRSFTIQSPARVICHSPSDGKIKDDKSSIKKKSTRSLSFENSVNVTVKDDSTGSTSIKKLKKKKYLPVQSRYKKQPIKKEDPKSRSLELSVITPHPNSQASSQPGQKKPNRVTSTPVLMSSMYEAQSATDGSILDQTRFQTNEPSIKEPLQQKRKVTRQRDFAKKKDVVTEYHKDGKSDNEMDQLTLDIHYARLLHMTYLNMKARQTFQKQEDKAKAEIYGLWAINRKLEKEIEVLTMSVKRQKLEIAIDQLLNVQIDGFKPLGNKLSKLSIKTSRLLEAVVNTTHYLPIRKIKIDSEEKLSQALDESKRLLAEIQSLTRRCQPELEELSSTSEVLMKTVKTEVSEQERCIELLAACSTLMNQERSLQAQVLQES